MRSNLSATVESQKCYVFLNIFSRVQLCDSNCTKSWNITRISKTRTDPRAFVPDLRVQRLNFDPTVGLENSEKTNEKKHERTDIVDSGYPVFENR